MKVHFYDIVWDTDSEKIDLPTELMLEVEDDLDLSLEGAGILSDETGFLVESFSFKSH